ncbi:MAG TPA: spermidine synthase [Polyangia bacterium]|jgi:spermidine synthase
MARPWQTLERVETPAGPLELRRRGARDFLITIAGRILMTSAAHRSEDALAVRACAAVAARPAPRVLVGGLGMGYTLRAALDALPAAAAVTVAELNPQVVAWCRGPLAALSAAALDDARVTVAVADVTAVIAAARGLDAIILDLYEGPHAATQGAADPLYGAAALARVARALTPGGVFAVWSEEPDRPFEARLRAGGFSVEVHRARGGRAHVVYLSQRLAQRLAPR